MLLVLNRERLGLAVDKTYSWYEPKPLRYLYFSALLNDVVGIDVGVLDFLVLVQELLDVPLGQWLSDGARHGYSPLDLLEVEH